MVRTLPAALAVVSALAVPAEAPAAAARARPALLGVPGTVPPTATIRFGLRSSRGVREARFKIDGRRTFVDRRAPFAYGRDGRIRESTLGVGRHVLAARVWARGRRPHILRRTVQVVAAPAAVTAPAELAPPPPPPEAVPPGPGLLWSDEFNGHAGALPDAAKWGHDRGRWGTAAGEQQYYTDRAENAAMDGQGNLRIVARPEAFGGAGYTSARLTTQDRFEPLYGRLEARIRAPAGRGVLPQFWTLGYDHLQGASWPQTGEIDVMEIPGHEPATWYGHVHGPSTPAPATDADEQRVAGFPAPLGDDFHIYAMDWREDSVQFSVDGVPAGPPITPATYAAEGGTWVFNRAHYLLLDIAIANAWTGPPDGSTPWPAVMLVDWVRHYG